MSQSASAASAAVAQSFVPRLCVSAARGRGDLEAGSSSPHSYRSLRTPPLAISLTGALVEGSKRDIEHGQRQFHRALLANLAKPLFEELEQIVQSHGSDSEQAQAQRERIAGQYPMPAAWLEAIGLSPSTEGAATPRLLRERASPSGLQPRWISDLRERGYGDQLLERLQEYLKACRLMPREVGSLAADAAESQRVLGLKKIDFKTVCRAHIGDRETMEDVVVCESFALGKICMVADGHKDGGKIARLCAERFAYHLQRQTDGKQKLTRSDLLEAWRLTQDEVNARQDEMLRELGFASVRQAAQSGQLEPDQAAFLLGGSVFAASVLLHSGELHTLTLGDCTVSILRQTQEGTQVIPVSLVRDFRHRREQMIAGQWIKLQSQPKEPSRVLLKPTTPPSERLATMPMTPVTNSSQLPVALSSPQEETPGDREVSEITCAQELLPSPLGSQSLQGVPGTLVAAASSGESNYVGDVHQRTLQEWLFWPEELSPPHIHTSFGYSNTARSLGDRWLQELTKGALPIRQPKSSSVELLPGDVILTHSDGMHLSTDDLACVLSAMGPLETLDLEDLARAICGHCLASHPLEWPQSLRESMPARLHFERKQEWERACLQWLETMLEKAPGLFAEHADVLPAPVFFDDTGSWKQAVEERMERIVFLAQVPSSSEKHRLCSERALTFLACLSKVGQLDAKELRSADEYRRLWRSWAEEELEVFDAFIGFFPLGVGLSAEMDEAFRAQSHELCAQVLADWIAMVRHDNISLSAARVYPDEKPVVE